MNEIEIREKVLRYQQATEILMVTLNEVFDLVITRGDRKLRDDVVNLVADALAKTRPLVFGGES